MVDHCLAVEFAFQLAPLIPVLLLLMVAQARMVRATEAADALTLAMAEAEADAEEESQSLDADDDLAGFSRLLGPAVQCRVAAATSLLPRQVRVAGPQRREEVLVVVSVWREGALELDASISSVESVAGGPSVRLLAVVDGLQHIAPATIAAGLRAGGAFGAPCEHEEALATLRALATRVLPPSGDVELTGRGVLCGATSRGGVPAEIVVPGRGCAAGRRGCHAEVVALLEADAAAGRATPRALLLLDAGCAVPPAALARMHACLVRRSLAACSCRVDAVPPPAPTITMPSTSSLTAEASAAAASLPQLLCCHVQHPLLQLGASAVRMLPPHGLCCGPRGGALLVRTEAMLAVRLEYLRRDAPTSLQPHAELATSRATPHDAHGTRPSEGAAAAGWGGTEHGLLLSLLARRGMAAACAPDACATVPAHRGWCAMLAAEVPPRRALLHSLMPTLLGAWRVWRGDGGGRGSADAWSDQAEADDEKELRSLLGWLRPPLWPIYALSSLWCGPFSPAVASAAIAAVEASTWAWPAQWPPADDAGACEPRLEVPAWLPLRTDAAVHGAVWLLLLTYTLSVVGTPAGAVAAGKLAWLHALVSGVMLFFGALLWLRLARLAAAPYLVLLLLLFWAALQLMLLPHPCRTRPVATLAALAAWPLLLFVQQLQLPVLALALATDDLPSTPPHHHHHHRHAHAPLAPRHGASPAAAAAAAATTTAMARALHAHTRSARSWRRAAVLCTHLGGNYAVSAVLVSSNLAQPLFRLVAVAAALYACALLTLGIAYSLGLSHAADAQAMALQRERAVVLLREAAAAAAAPLPPAPDAAAAAEGDEAMLAATDPSRFFYERDGATRARGQPAKGASPRSRARRTLELTAEMTAALTSGLAALAMSEEGGGAYCESDGEPDV